MRIAAASAALCLCAVGAAAHQPPQLQFGKAAQREAGIRTVLLSSVPEIVQLPGRVVADPRRELRVAAPQDGMVEPEGRQLPVAGQAVRAGQVLPQPDRRDLGSDLAAAERDKKLGRIQIDRYGIDEHQNLEIKLPTPSIEIVTNYHSAEARSGQIQDTLQHPLPLLAPRAGTILRSPAVAGRVVAGGQDLFDISAPGAPAVEAEFSDDDLDAAAAHLAHTADGREVPLLLLGSSYDAGLRSHRVLYAVAGDDLALAVNEPLQLEVPRTVGAGRYRLPAQSVFHHDGQDWVWLHVAPQSFTAVPVQVAAAADGQVLVSGALRDGLRVVGEGAAALAAAPDAGVP